MTLRSGEYTGYGLEKIINKFEFRIKRLHTKPQQMALPVIERIGLTTTHAHCTLVYSCTL